jgi:hypothetical protein
MRVALAGFGGTLVLLIVGFTSGCGFLSREPKTLEEARQRVSAARDEAMEKADKGDVKAAKKAMTRAEKTAAAAVVRAQCPQNAPDWPAACGEIQQTVITTRQLVELADETQRRAAIVSGLKAKAYRATRRTVLKLALESLAQAADQAAKVGPDALPPEVRESAFQACELIGSTDPKGCDWVAAAQKARKAAETQDDVALLLALGFAMSQKADLALIEADGVDCQALDWPPGECEAPLTVLRAIILVQNDMPRLAQRDIDRLAGTPGGEGRLSTNQMLAVWHGASAYTAFHDEGDVVKADRHLAQAMRFSPEMASFFTGEMPRPGGGYARVPRSLETMAEGTAFEASARALATRTRDLRDGKSAGGSLILDKSVVFELTLLYLREVGKREPRARRLVQVIDRSRAITDAVLRRLPGGGD